MNSEQEGSLGGKAVLEGEVGETSVWTSILVVAGCVLDVLSTFFPWSMTAGQHWFIPYSFPLLPVWKTSFISNSLILIIINVVIRTAAILGLLALFFYSRGKNVHGGVTLLLSAGCSLSCFMLFSRLTWPWYLGVYMVLIAGLLKLPPLLLENLELEITVEKE
ncbi:MAG: hypothetical protein ACOC6H_04070 [Thermoproteota archaeon]